MNRREPTTTEVLATLHTHDGDNIAERLLGFDVFNYGTKRAADEPDDLGARTDAAERCRQYRARKKGESA